jgi:hypothetical protein
MKDPLMILKGFFPVNDPFEHVGFFAVSLGLFELVEGQKEGEEFTSDRQQQSVAGITYGVE